MKSFDLKTTESVTFVEPLKSYIVSFYGTSPDTFSKDLHSLDAIRNDILQPDVHVSCLNKLLKYHAQLAFLNVKFPIDQEHIEIFFPWYNSIGKEKRQSSVPKLSFERASIIFNIAAMYSKLAASQNISSENGHKQAAQLLQQSAGALAHLLTCLEIWGVSEKGTAQLNSLLNLQLAQAQELFVQKARDGKMKHSLLSKISKAASEYYRIAKHEGDLAIEFEKEYIAHCEFMHCYYEALAHFYKGSEAAANNKYGQQISRYKIAVLKLKNSLDAKGVAKYISPALFQESKSFLENINSILPGIIKDNDIICTLLFLILTNADMEHITKEQDLDPLDSASMVKPIPLINGNELLKISGPPLFEKLMPFVVKDALNIYKNKCANLISSIGSMIEDVVGVSKKVMASLNLSGLLDESNDDLPSNVIQKSQSVKREGGAQALFDLWDNVKALSEKDFALLDEAIKVLDHEESQDLQMKSHFRENWKRAPSKELTKNLREAAKSFEEKLAQAAQSDILIKKDMDDKYYLIEGLCASKEELVAMIPKGSSTSLLKQDPNMRLLRSLIANLEEIHKKLYNAHSNMKELSAKDDISHILLETYSENSNLDLEICIGQQIEKYSPLKLQIEQLRSEHDTILNQIYEVQKIVSNISETVRHNSERDIALANLNNGYLVFYEIKKNLEEGIKFYNDFQNVISKFSTNCKDFAFAREINKRDSISSIEENIAKMHIAISPQKPAYSPGMYGNDIDKAIYNPSQYAKNSSSMGAYPGQPLYTKIDPSSQSYPGNISQPTYSGNSGQPSYNQFQHGTTGSWNSARPPQPYKKS